MDYKIDIPQFEGPLDLLLHLIKEDNIDIFDISIDRITKQYLDYINKMEELNLNVASEYLVMAAELIEMKSKTLLPIDKNDEDEEEDDPRERLINKLIEYQKYKDISPTFKELESIRGEVFTRSADDLSCYYVDSDADYGVDLNDLVMAFNKFLENKKLDKPLNTKVTNKEYSVSKRSVEIRDILREKKKVDFNDLFEVYNREYIVVTFLAILAMSKRQELLIEQNDNFENIIVKIKE